MQHIHIHKTKHYDGVTRTHHLERTIEAYGRTILASEQEVRIEIAKNQIGEPMYTTTVSGFIIKHNPEGISKLIEIPRSYKNFTRYLLKKEGLKGKIEFQKERKWK